MSAGAGVLLVMVTSACPETTTTQSKVRTFTLTLSTAGAGTGSVVPTPLATFYAEGTNVSVVATPLAASTFTGWSGDCTGVANPCSLTMSDNRTVTATFTPSTAVGSGVLTAAGPWHTTSDQLTLRDTLFVTGTAVTGQGTLTVSIPNYTGDAFVISSGTFVSPDVSFDAALGRNPDGRGGFFIGSLSFTGKVTSASTMSGTLIYTPPRTVTQTFATQTVTNLTLTKP